MAYKTLDPTTIERLEDLERVFLDMESYARDFGQNDCGVALRQNRQFGGSYHLTSREEYEARKQGEGRVEWYCYFWPRSYFENLKKKFVSENN